MRNFLLPTHIATDQLITSARRTISRIRALKSLRERLPLVISAEESIARLRAYNATGRLYGRFQHLYDLENALKRIKSTPAMRRELGL